MKKKLFSEIPELKGERITLKALTLSDAHGLRELTKDEYVNRYLPTFLFEKKYDDPKRVIERLYNECIKTSLILGVFKDDEFCGLAEIYGYNASLLKASVGCRLLPRYWGKGIVTEAVGLMLDYLLNKTNVEIVTASTMRENKASAKSLKKCGFKRVLYAVPENWGYPKPVLTDKWVRTGASYRLKYRFNK